MASPQDPTALDRVLLVAIIALGSALLSFLIIELVISATL